MEIPGRNKKDQQKLDDLFKRAAALRKKSAATNQKLDRLKSKSAEFLGNEQEEKNQ